MHSSFPARPACFFLEMVRSDGGYSKEFVVGELRRLELYGTAGELLHLFIYRPDLGLSWCSMPRSKVLYEYAMNPSTSTAGCPSGGSRS